MFNIKSIKTFHIVIIQAALFVPSFIWITSLPANALPNILAAIMPNNIPINLRFCYFAFFLTVLLTLFNNKLESLRDLTIFMISFKSSSKNIDVVALDPQIFLWVAASVEDAVAVDSKGTKTLLASDWSKCFIKG